MLYSITQAFNFETTYGIKFEFVTPKYEISTPFIYFYIFNSEGAKFLHNNLGWLTQAMKRRNPGDPGIRKTAGIPAVVADLSMSQIVLRPIYRDAVKESG